MTENLSFLFQYLKEEKITIDQNEFTFQVQSHTDYPSLLAISDTLSFFKIDNLATGLESENIEHLPNTFIGLLKEKENSPFLSFIKRTKNGFQYKQDKKAIIITNDTFQEMFQNVVLLAEKDENESIQTSPNKVLILVLIFIGILYLISVFTTSYSLLSILFVCFAVIGAYLSIAAISHEFGIKTKFSEAVCTITPNSDCEAVINSKKTKILKLLSFSDVSIIFFSSQIFGLLVFSISNQLESFYNITFITLLFSLPVTLLSFYQQIIITKKWCPICLAIIVIVYSELLSLLILNNFSLTISSIPLVYFSLIIAGSYLTSVYARKITKENIELKASISENNRFRRKYSLFKMALLASGKINSNKINSNKILLGNTKANIKIILIFSPFCTHCKTTHNLISEILDRWYDKVYIDFRFNFNYEKSNDISKRIHQKLVKIYFAEGEVAFMKALERWFENKDEEKLITPEKSQLSDLKINEILREQLSWNYENKITFTPAIIINEHFFPNEYDRTDLIYFINDLDNDQDFI